jgi:hypothetical protein
MKVTEAKRRPPAKKMFEVRIRGKRLPSFGDDLVVVRTRRFPTSDTCTATFASSRIPGCEKSLGAGRPRAPWTLPAFVTAPPPAAPGLLTADDRIS